MVPTTAGRLEFRRTYSLLAIGATAEPLSPGWTRNHQTRLIFPGDPEGEPGVVLFQADTANRVEFLDNEDGAYIPAPGVCGTLTRDDGPPVTYTVTDEAQRRYVFDQDGRIFSWFDANGRSWTYSYDLNGRLAEVSDDSGDRFLLFTYDGMGRLTLIEDQAERQVSFAYDANGDLSAATDVLGQTWTYLYDASHRLTEVIDPRGITVERTVQTDPNGGNASTTYDLNFRPVAITDETNDTTTLEWSFDGTDLTQVIDAEGGQTDLTYDALNNLTAVSDPRGFTTTYT